MIAFIFRLFAVVGLCSAFLSAPAMAQISMATGGGTSSEAAPALPDPLTPEAVNSMVAQMSDDQVRSLLLQRLDAVAQEEVAKASAEKSLVESAQELWGGFTEAVVGAIVRLPNLFTAQWGAFKTFFAHLSETGGALLFVGYAIAAFAIGLVAEFLFNRLAKRWIGDSETLDHDSLWASVKFLFRRFTSEIVGLILFWYVGTIAIEMLIVDSRNMEIGESFLLLMVMLPRMGGAISRMLMAPHRPEVRLVNISTENATSMHKGWIGLYALAGFTYFIIHFNSLNGVPMGETRIGFWLNLSVHIYVIIFTWVFRDAASKMLAGGEEFLSDGEQRAVHYYPYFVIFVAAFTWVIISIVSGLGNNELVLQTPQYTTMLWVIMAPALDTMVRGLVNHLVPPMIGEGPIAEEAYRKTKRSYVRIGRVVLIALVILAIADAWNIDLLHLASAGVGSRIASSLIEFLLVIAVGYVLLEVVALWVNRRLAAEQTSREVTEDQAQGEGGGGSGSRLATVLPLALISAQIAICIIFGLLALGTLGMDITPLLAGAGILGLAIGFGAQKLVTDIVSGVFFLIDDAFRVGEYVEVDGATTGTVEKISVRSMQLRHHRGPVHTIPYGEIPKLTNYSRDWVIMKLKFTVPFDTDPNKVKKIFKKIGAAMLEDPLFKDDFLEPFKSQGVFDIDDVGMVIRGKFMAKPGTQFTIRKEIYNRVKAAFNENGIDFARREVRVAMPDTGGAPLTDEQKTALAAAASEAANQGQQPT